METSFIKFYTGQFGGEWTARVQVKPKNESLPIEEVALIWYVALDEKTEGYIAPDFKQLYRIEGETKGLGKFRVNLHNSSGTIVKQSFLSTTVPNLQKLRETVLTNLRLASDKQTMQKFIILAGDVADREVSFNLFTN